MFWEYYVIDLELIDDIAEIEKQLDDIGYLGWELVAVKKTVYILALITQVRAALAAAKGGA